MPLMGPPTAVPVGKRKRNDVQDALSEPSTGPGSPKRARTPDLDTVEYATKDDSDEEENDELSAKDKYEIMAEDDVEGQEDGTMKVDDGVRITPFNLQEEMEEGHFDKDGNFHGDKDKEIKDAWLDGLDQFADEDYEKLRKKKADEAAAEEAAAPLPQSDSELYKVILTVLKPGESIGRALRRLGSGIKPTQRVKKGSTSSPAGSGPLADDPVKKEFDLLTSAADTILQKGNLEIYQETYEKIQHRLAKADAKLASLTHVNDDADIFAVDFDATKVSSFSASTEKADSFLDDDGDNNSQTTWEYKWQNNDSAEIHGPFSSEQMVDWVNQDFFKDGVFVRKAGVIDAPFYSSKRVDFDLYT